MGSFINKVAVMESDILQHLKYEWDTDYIYSIECVEDAINTIAGTEAGIVKKTPCSTNNKRDKTIAV